MLVHIHCSNIANQMLDNGCCKTRSEKLSSRALLPYHVIKPNHAKPLMLITSNMAIGQVLCNSNIRWRSKITSHQPWCKSSFFIYCEFLYVSLFYLFAFMTFFARGVNKASPSVILTEKGFLEGILPSNNLLIQPT